MADNPDIRWAASAFDTDSTTTYRKYGDYLAGSQPLSFATPKFRSAFGRHFEEFAYNRCSMVIDAMADRMQVSGFGADDETISTDAQAIWDANTMDVRQGQVHREQFAAGDGYVYVEVDPDSGDVVIWPQSAANVRVRYSTIRPGERELAVKRWREDGYWRLNLYYRDRIEKYRSTNRSTLESTAVSESADTTMTATGAYEPHRIQGEDWPLKLAVTDTVPVFHFANNAGVGQRGTSELHDVIPVQDALNKSLMDLLVAMEFGAYPQRWMVNVDTDADGAADAIQRFQAGLDRILDLQGGEGVSLGEFAATNIEQYTNTVELFDTLISRVSKVPVHYLKMSGDFPSGTALRLAEAPFVSKMRDRQLAAAADWSEVMRYALRLGGRDVAPGLLRVNFESAAPMAEEERVALMLQKKALGLPLEQILKEDGRDPKEIEAILKQKAAEDAAAVDRQRSMFDAGFVPSGGGE